MVTMVGNEGNTEKLDLLYLDHEAIAAYVPASTVSTTKLSAASGEIALNPACWLSPGVYASDRNAGPKNIATVP